MWVYLLWLLCAVFSALAIAIDMRSLGATKVGLSLPTWGLVCTLVGPLAWVPYLVLRPTARQQLIDAAWAFIGDGSHPLSTRHSRLKALRQVGLIGPSIYRICLRSMNAGMSSFELQSIEEQRKDHE
ncbi:MAG: hypothetical protein J0H69_00060 [Burkholderiales bacterium]|nr:hypothetical protein [Burkholderiales bacterium]